MDGISEIVWTKSPVTDSSDTTVTNRSTTTEPNGNYMYTNLLFQSFWDIFFGHLKISRQ